MSAIFENLTCKNLQSYGIRESAKKVAHKVFGLIPTTMAYSEILLWEKVAEDEKGRISEDHLPLKSDR